MPIQITPTRFVFSIFSILANLLLGLTLLRTRLDKTTLNFLLILWLLPYMFIFLGSPNMIADRFSTSVISFYPVVTLHFFIILTLEKYNKVSTFLLLIQITLAILRDLATIDHSIFRQLHNLIFFGSLFMFYLFCTYLYIQGSNSRTLFTSKQKKRVLRSLIFSFAPFIVVSLGSAVFIYQDSLPRFLWTLFFILYFPIVMGDILTQENLILRKYWKKSLVNNYFSFLVLLCIPTVSLSFILRPSLAQVVSMGYFLLFFFFICSFVFLLYSDWKTNKVTEKLMSFPEEKRLLTKQLAENIFFEKVKSFIEKSLSNSIKLEDMEIVFNTEFYDTKLQDWFINHTHLLEQIRDLFSSIHYHSKKYLVTEVGQKSYIILPLDRNMKTHLIIKSNQPREEISDIQVLEELQPIIQELFESAKDLSSLSIDHSEHFYTQHEKSMFRQEIDLAEKYQAFIANYLHDEVLQSVLSIRTTAYKKQDPKLIRSTIEFAIEQIETSLRRKMVEWEPSSIPDKTLKESISELVQKLVTRYNKAIFVNINIPHSLDLPISFQQFIYRAIRELMINAYKHSDATRLDIHFIIEDKLIRLIVKDNGKGFNTQEKPLESNDFHFGLYSIYQHTHGLDGEFSIDKSKDGGAKIELVFPKKIIEKEVN